MFYIDRERVELVCYDGFKLDAYIYGDYNKNFKGVVQIVHGKGEYSTNYENIIKFLIKNSYVVVINDHRGHGKYNEGKKFYSYVTDDNYFVMMVKDLKTINTFIRNKFPTKKVFLVGHSMGGYLSLKYSEVYGDSIDGLVLCGIGKDYKIKLNSQVLISRFICGFNDVNKPNEFVNKTVYKILNKKFKEDRDIDNKYAFTTSNKQVLKKYSEDDLRIKEYTLKFYHDLFDGIRHSLKSESLNKINKDLKILIVAAELDPVCSFKRGVKLLGNAISKCGVNCEFKIYENMRHEVFIEDGNEKVFNDVLNFIDKIV